MTKDAAILVVATKNALEPTWFCPLIKGTCNKKCVCYVSARIYGYNTYFKYGGEVNEWTTYDPYCSNTMFTRGCSHNT